MSLFVARRLRHALFTLLGVSLLSFLLLDLAPGNYFQAMRLNPQISPETVSALRAQYGVDRPLPVRYWAWLRSVAHGEIGYSFAYNRPVWPLLRGRLLNTLILTVAALVLAWFIALLAGTGAAARYGQWPDRLVAMGTAFLVAVPDVLLGLALLAFALRTRWFPAGGMTSLTFSEMGWLAKLKDASLHLVLPVVALAGSTLPLLVRHVRSSVMGVLGSSFIMAARGHGIPRSRLLFRHVLPAAMNPLVSLFGVSAGIMLGGSLLIEVIMNWPGIGPMLVQAIFERDPYVVLAGVMATTILLVAGNLAADIMLYFADPRIRED